MNLGSKYFISLEVGNYILKNWENTANKLQDVFLMNNPYIENEKLMRAWKTQQAAIKKANSAKEEDVMYILKDYGFDLEINEAE